MPERHIFCIPMQKRLHKGTTLANKKLAELFGTFEKISYLCSKLIKKGMKTSQEYVDIIKAHSSELHQRFGITSMRLFGSVARGDHHEGSDVDIFVTMPPKFFNLVLAAQYLEELLGCEVDLISDHENIRPFFRQQIEKDGINIFTAA